MRLKNLTAAVSAAAVLASLIAPMTVSYAADTLTVASGGSVFTATQLNTAGCAPGGYNSTTGTAAFTDDGKGLYSEVSSVFGASYTYDGQFGFVGSTNGKNYVCNIPLSITTADNYMLYVYGADQDRAVSAWVDVKNAGYNSELVSAGAIEHIYKYNADNGAVYAVPLGYLSYGAHTITLDNKTYWAPDIRAVAVYPANSSNAVNNGTVNIRGLVGNGSWETDTTIGSTRADTKLYYGYLDLNNCDVSVSAGHSGTMNISLWVNNKKVGTYTGAGTGWTNYTDRTFVMEAGLSESDLRGSVTVRCDITDGYGGNFGALTLKNNSIASISLNKSSYKMDAYNLTTIYLTAATTSFDGTVAWSSSDTSVADVENGVVTAKKAGTATITATAGTAAATCDITVTDSSFSAAEVVENLSATGTELYVGADKAYKTINAALAAAENESGRVIINVDPGTYREQVIVKKPYVTIRKTPGTSGKVLMTWYYGTGQKYYSSVDGKYDAEAAAAKSAASGVSNWGATLQVEASDFVLENIYLENSFNRYLTAEEQADNAGGDGDGAFQRAAAIKALQDAGCSEAYINQWLQSRTSLSECDKISGFNSSFRERAAAMYITGDRAQFRGCTIVSTQDTIGIMYGREYFDRCLIAGTVDYICGSSAAVFNDCELRWNSGPILTAAQGEKDTDMGYIAVPNMSSGNGYVFYNCEITGNAWSTGGSLGRPWNQNGEAVFINTRVNKSARNGVLLGENWSGMSGSVPEKARFGEYGHKTADGSAIDTSSWKHGYNLDEWTMLRFNPYTQIAGSDGWDPSGMKSVYDAIQTAASSLSVNAGGESAVTTLPTLSGYDLHWETNAADFVSVNPDGTSITAARPAPGESAIASSVQAYVRKTGTERGVTLSVPVTIAAMTSTEGLGTVTARIATDQIYSEDKSVNVKLMNGRAVLKTATITLPANSTSASCEIPYVPAGTYSVIMAAPDGMQANGNKTVTVPENGSVNYAVALSSTSNITKTAASSVDTTQAVQIIDLAAPGMEKATKVTVSYKLHVDQSALNPNHTSYANAAIDLYSGTPSDTYKAEADTNRYVRTRINSWWNQLDMISGEMADFEGTENIENKQILNSAGKFENISGGVDYSVNIELDYINGTITERSSGKADTEYTFSPLTVNNKIDLKLAVYNNGGVVYTLSDVKVSYDTAAPVKYEYEASGDIASSKKQYRDLEGDAADTYAADIDYSEYFVKGLKWVVTNNEDKKAEISLTDTPAISGSGSVSFGLILYGDDGMLDAVKSVELKAE